MTATAARTTTVEVRLPSRLGFEKVAMSTAASVAKLMGFREERIDDLKAHNILYERDGNAEYLQVYTRTFEERFFFEIVERRGYAGFGAANAPIRLAAQTRLARRRAAPASAEE